MICHVLLFSWGFIFQILRPAKDQITFLLCPDKQNNGIQKGVLSFSHDCIYSSSWSKFFLENKLAYLGEVFSALCWTACTDARAQHIIL